MMDIMERAGIVLLVLIGVPFLIGVLMLVVVTYIAAIDWVWLYLQAWWMA